ncbi:OmpA family protein [Shinella curvata]|uniref:OmpA family protein n=1 Tax=Shinella curvata TaxID=1817964 RepID=A0ABT8X9R9_9HYPH|nr:OmpA family protein [Shinella curvata]MCJ8051868.1 OmpA family protein [Shinella curvata]MDO6120184.1 OmpA family protein [Shinella curvata]
MRSLAATLFVMAGVAPAAAACDAFTGVIEAFNAGDEQKAQSIAETAGTANCSANERTLVGRVAALSSFNRIATDVGNGGKLVDHRADLEMLQKKYGGPWQVFDALGDLARERKDYEEAAKLYQIALEDGSNTTLTPDWMAPDEQYILRLDRLAGEMRLAAPRPVKLAMRGGCKVSFRGVAIKKKSTPVRYVFGTADFTPEGVEAAKDLAECLKAVKPSAIKLIGHTDPVGGADANYALSLARADTLKAYLHDTGYAGTITTIGKGEDEPFKPDDASAYDTETLNQLNRRVEVDVQ